MKKNKKYWKKEYKALSKLYYDLEDSLDQYAMSNIILQDRLDKLEDELDRFKNSKSTTTTSGSWNVGFSPIIHKAKDSCSCKCNCK